MAKKKQDEEVDEYNVFRCTTCADQPEFEGNAIKEHLQQVHGIEGEPKGTRRMTMHVDGRTFFRSTQEWTLEGGVTLVQFTQHRRIAVLRPLAPPANPRNPRRRTRHNAIARMTKRGRQHPVRSHTMITQFIQGSAHSLPQLAAGSVQMIATLFDVFACGVGVAMHPMMAVAAQGDEVVRFGTQGGVACPRFEVMSVEMTSSAASGASVIVSGVDSAEYGLPFSVAIGALAFWGAAVNVIRVQRPTLSILAVSIATQVRLFDLRLNAQNLSSFGRVGFTEKRIHSTRAAHVAIIRCREVLSARARGNAVISQPLVNTFRIAMNNLANVISAKSFVNVLLAQPSFVNRLLCALPVAFALEGTEAARLATA